MVVAEAKQGTARSGACHHRIGRFLHPLVNFHWLCFSVPIAQIIFLLWLIWTRTPQVPTHDEWATVLIVQRFDEGNLDLATLWAPHGQHRIVIPRIVNLLIIELTGWNRQVEMTLNLLIASFTAYLLFLCLRSTFRSRPAVSLLSIPVSLLVFSPAQYENWLEPFQIAFIATAFGYVLSVWAVAHDKITWTRFIVAILGAMVASLSSAGGLPIWIVLFPVLFIVTCSWWKRLAWGLAGLSIVVPYFVGLHLPSTASQAPVSPLKILRFALTLLGAPMGFPSVSLSELAAVVGALLAVMNILVLLFLHRSSRSALVWISLTSLVSGFAVITGFGREMLGYEQALMTRYQSFTALWWVSIFVTSVHSTICLVSHSLPGLTSRLALRGVIILNSMAIVALLAGFLRNDIVGIKPAMAWMDLQRDNQECVVYYRYCPDNYAGWFLGGDLNAFRRWSAVLESRQLSVFKTFKQLALENLQPRDDQTDFDIHVIGKEAFIPTKQSPIVASRAERLFVEGWAIDTPARNVAGGVYIIIEEGIVAPAIYGKNRPDVGAHLGNGAYNKSGFYTAIPLDQLSPGAHQLSIRIISADRTSYFSPNLKVELLVE